MLTNQGFEDRTTTTSLSSEIYPKASINSEQYDCVTIHTSHILYAYPRYEQVYFGISAFSPSPNVFRDSILYSPSGS